MPSPIPVTAPALYAPLSAIGFAEPDSTLAAVAADRPLPVNPVSIPAPAPLAGTASESTLAGPFSPTSPRPLVLTLSGSWSGTVRLLRSTDQGATRAPLTAGGLPWGEFTANCCEPVWEETAGATFYLDITLSAGVLRYQVAQ